jgi:hypothetical protein
MRRRDVLRAGGPVVLSALGGCLAGDSGSESDSDSDTPRPEFDDPSPEWSRQGEVYYKGHRIGMKMIGAKQLDTISVALSYTYTERFWRITGNRTQRVGDGDGYNGIHLMASLWHTETKTAIPVDTGLRVRVERDGETITERAPWPMISQRMGFHFGDNFEFPEQTTYSLVVDVGTTDIPGNGLLEDAFDGSGTARFELDFSRPTRNEIPISDLLDQRGERGAFSPMEMEMVPLSVAPSKGELPGRVIGDGTSGDALFVVTEADSGDGTYLTVSPRTPYNRYVLPLMTLSVIVERDGTTVFEGPLSSAIDADRHYHYRTFLDRIESGDEITVRVDSPPQVSRHAGYETAFLDMPDVTLTV